MARRKPVLRRSRKKRRLLDRMPPGSVPGSVVADPDAPHPVVRVMAYGPDDFVEREVEDLSQIGELREKWPVTWVNVDGLGDAELIRAVGEAFDIHPLALEDVVNVTQRPKVEEYDNFEFIVARMASVVKVLETEQVSIFLGKGFVVTFQERVGDCFDPVRERIRTGRGRVRGAGADYLAYALLDAVVDNYFPVLEQYGERLEALEERILVRSDTATVAEIHDVKRELIRLRRAVWPLREAVNTLTREAMPLITDETRVYLRDCYDHAVQILDIVESDREMTAGLTDLYQSTVSNRMNEVMKVLTIIATIFIPLTFIAGIYGMNFDPEASRWSMPELGWPFGYVACLGVMAVCAVSLVVFFKRKGWLGSPAQPVGKEDEDAGGEGADSEK